MLARWMNGVQMMTPQLGFSAVSVSLSSFARAIPSCRFMFIFQLPATIFFLIFFRFKSLYILVCLSLFLTNLDHAQSLSASVRRSSGSTNHVMMDSTRLAVVSSGCRPSSMRSSLSVSWYSSGRRLWLHFRITRPDLMRTSPGLLRITVCRVVASVEQNGYSAPVMSRHRSMARSVLAVRQ